MSLSVQYDAAADAAFIEIAEGTSASTVIVSDDINVDLDVDGRLLSIEVLSVSRVAPALAVQSVSSIAAE
jgi:uncharacterized protein YuzE